MSERSRRKARLCKFAFPSGGCESYQDGYEHNGASSETRKDVDSARTDFIDALNLSETTAWRL